MAVFRAKPPTLNMKLNFQKNVSKVNYMYVCYIRETFRFSLNKINFEQKQDVTAGLQSGVGSFFGYWRSIIP